MRNQVAYAASKRIMLMEEGSGIQTLVLGSSHGDFGFNPEFFPGSFNLCSRSQDLKHSYHLYESHAKRCSSLRNVVVFFSVFSPGFILEKARSEAYLSAVLNQVFNLGIQYETDSLKAFSWAAGEALRQLSYCFSGSKGFMPEVGKKFLDTSCGPSKRANDHLRFNGSDGAIAYLAGILLVARLFGHAPYIVVPPARSDYRAALGMSPDRLFRGVFKLLDELSFDPARTLLNFFDSPLFNDSHFGDFDHLHPTGDGVEILSGRIRESVSMQPAA